MPDATTTSTPETPPQTPTSPSPLAAATEIRELVLALDSAEATAATGARAELFRSANAEAMAEYASRVKAHRLEQELRAHLMTRGYSHYVAFRKVRVETRKRRVEALERIRRERQNMAHQIAVWSLVAASFCTAALLVWLLWLVFS